MRWRALAALVLATAVAPSLAGVADAVHLFSDDDAPDREAPGDVHDPLHGHHHQPKVPPHEHVIVLGGARSLAARSWHTVIAAVDAFPASGASTVCAPALKAAAQPAAPGPPPRARSVILRI
jgi:hypothetical protein